jgi:large subunit ribosomal protein L12e
MRDRSCARKLTGTVKEILGTCVSVGCTVDGEDPREIQSKIDEGEVDVPEE